MSEGLNKVMLIGNLGADPELKYTQGGGAILKLRLATTERYKDKSGERQERTEWHSVTVWGNRAEALSKILEKGKAIYIEGRLQTSSWDDKDGVKRYKTEINASEILLLGGPRGGGESKHREQDAPRPGASTQGTSGFGGSAKHAAPADDGGGDFGGDPDDQIPFAIPFTLPI